MTSAKIEEINRRGNTKNLFKRIRDIKGTFHVKMGTIKDRNSMDLTNRNIQKRWQEYTEVVYRKKKTLMTQITMIVRSLT